MRTKEEILKEYDDAKQKIHELETKVMGLSIEWALTHGKHQIGDKFIHVKKGTMGEITEIIAAKYLSGWGESRNLNPNYIITPFKKDGTLGKQKLNFYSSEWKKVDNAPKNDM